MPQCPTNEGIFTASQGPQGGVASSALRNANGYTAAEAGAAAQEQTRINAQTQQEYINKIRNSFGTYQGAAVAPDKLSPGTRQVARKIMKWWGEAKKSYEKRMVNDWNEDLHAASGATAGVHSRWMNICASLDKVFKNARAPLDHWAAVFSAQTDRAWQNNDLVVSANLMQATTKGMGDKLRGLLMGRETMDIVMPIVKRTGYSKEDVCTFLGEAANLKGVPSRNQLLLDRWAKQIREIESLPALERDYTELMKLMDKREQLLKHLDNENVVRERDGTVVSCGYTNGEARVKMRDILAQGFTEAEIDAFSKRMTAISDQITQARIDAGLIHPNQIAAFPKTLEYYVPFQSKKGNNSGSVNDARVYNPGRYYEMVGSADARPDSAYWTLMNYARRAANEIGMKDYGMRLLATAQVHEAKGIKSGLLYKSERELARMRNSNDYSLRHLVNTMEERGGIYVDGPVVNKKTGQVDIKRVLLYFDPNFKDEKSGLTGAKLNEALIAAPKYNSGLTQAAATANSWYGQLFTRTPVFSVVNGMRDLVERSFHMSNYEMHNERGDLVTGISLVPKYFKNSIRAGKMLYDNLRGYADPNSMGAQYWREYTDAGLHMEYTPGMDESRRTIQDVLEARNKPKSGIEKALDNPAFKPLKDLVSGLGEKGGAVMDTLNAWNDYFNNIASFNEFITLREAGLSARQAVNQTRLSMDLHQTGTLTPVMRALYPFVRPTVQSGAAMMRTMGFTYDPRGFFKGGRRGIAYMLGAYAALSSLLPVIREALGQDEDGNDVLDAIPMSVLTKSIPIGIGDRDYVKLPIGFGPVQLVAAMVFGQDRLLKGQMTPEDLGAELLFTGLKNLAPGNAPEFNLSQNPAAWLTQMFSPTWARPVTELATNTNYFGAEIARPQQDKSVARALSGRSSTPVFYHKLAKDILQTTGIDLAPEQIRSIEDNLLAGPLRLIKVLYHTEDSDIRKGGLEESASERINPFIAAMGGSMIWGSVSNMDRALFYNAATYYQDKIKKAGIRLKDSSYGRDKARRIAYQENLLAEHGFSLDEIEDILTIEAVRGSIGQLNSALSKGTRKLWTDAESVDVLKEAFAQVAENEAELYKNAISGLHFYRR